MERSVKEEVKVVKKKTILVSKKNEIEGKVICLFYFYFIFGNRRLTADCWLGVQKKCCSFNLCFLSPDKRPLHVLFNFEDGGGQASLYFRESECRINRHVISYFWAKEVKQEVAPLHFLRNSFYQV